METDLQIENLRKASLTVYRIHEKALNEFLDHFKPAILQTGDFFCKAGEVHTHMAYITNGICASYYSDEKSRKIVKGFYSRNMFLVPLPPFVSRNPSFLNFEAITELSLLSIKFNHLEELARKHDSIKVFLRSLIEKEWIIHKEEIESSRYKYNSRTRFALLQKQLGKDIDKISNYLLSSYLNIPEKQLIRYKANIINDE